MKTKTKILKNLFRIINLINRNDKKYIYLSTISVLINGLIPLLSILVMQEIINRIQVDATFNTVKHLIGIYLVIDLFQVLFNSFLSYYSAKFSMDFTVIVSEMTLKKSSKLALIDYENSKTYDIINRAQNENGVKLINYYDGFVSMFTQLITLFSYLIILIKFRIWLIILISILPIIKFNLNSKFNKISFNIIRDRTNEQRKSWYMNYLLTYGNYYKELKTYNLHNYFIEKYKDYLKKFNNQDLKINKDKTISFLITSIFELIIDGLLFAYIVFLGITQQILIGDVLTYTRTITGSKNSITNILLTISNLIKDSLFIDQLFEFLGMREIDNKNKVKIKEIDSIDLKNLSFKYPNSNKYSLKNISISIAKNEKIAIVGMNGSGKTTLIKIIMGLYDNYEGEVYVNKINLKNIDKDSLLERTSTLFQDFIKYEATLKENITYGNLKIINGNEDIYKYIETFKLDKLNRDLAKGIDTQLGVWFDDGINISMGQWQKVALARSFVKDSDVYILDEPSSSLDLISENEMVNLYEDILENKIGIIITHRLTELCKKVDQIIVLEDGEIIQQGIHDELYNVVGLYRKLYK